MPNKRTLITIFILWMLYIPLSNAFAGLNTGAWPMFRADLQHTGQSKYQGIPLNSIKWQLSLGGYYSSPSIDSDGTVYIGSSGTLYAVNADGSIKWTYKTNQDYMDSSPAIDSFGTVYVSAYNSGGQGELNVNNYLYAINSDGTLKWKYLKWTLMNSGGRDSSPSIGIDGTIYDGSRDNFLYALSNDGILKWRYQTGGSITSSPAIALDGTIYIGSGDAYIYAINSDGSLKWRYQTGGSITSSPAIALDGTIYIGSGDAYIYAINPDGSLKWRYQAEGAMVSSPAIASDGTIYVGDYYLHAISPEGLTKWKYQIGSADSWASKTPSSPQGEFILPR